jgi:phosphoenolpyruvate synthase/pyruvate phosphate dikinase
MIFFDLETPEEIISPDIVGNKFYNLYLLNKLPEVHIPPAFCITETHYDVTELNRRLKPGRKYAIRSSASIEDTRNYSAAGIFKSYLNLADFEEIRQPVLKAFISLKLRNILNSGI